MKKNLVIINTIAIILILIMGLVMNLTNQSTTVNNTNEEAVETMEDLRTVLNDLLKERTIEVIESKEENF